MTKRLVLHIGLAKTGTTSFQHDCRRHRRLLARNGVLYPRAMCGFAKNHSPLAAAYLAHRPHDPTIAMRVVPRADAVAAVTAEIEASPCPVALLSSEHFSIHFDPYEAAQLAQDFAAYAPEIVVAIREPYGRFLSMWNTQVTAGGALTLEDYARTILVPDNRFISIRETLVIWRQAFGAQRVHVIDWDAGCDPGAAILARCGADAPLPGGRRRRVSLPLGAIETLRLVNEMLAVRQPSPGVAPWAQRSAFSWLARQRLARMAFPKEKPIVSEQTIQALDAIYAQDSAWLAETYGLSLASSRDRLVVGAPPPPSDAQRIAATELLRGVSRGLWPVSTAAVRLAGRRKR
jgi:hypothetical protein